MDRRRALRTLAAGAAALAAPAFIRSAFAQTAPCPVRTRAAAAGTLPHRRDGREPPRDVPGDLRSAWVRAERSLRPMLVLVVPSAEDQSFERGSAFGSWINFGSDEQLAHLACCEVTCATMQEVRGALSGLGAGEPLMLFVESMRPASFVRLEGTLPRVLSRTRGPGAENDENRIVDQRIEYLSSLLASALAPDAATVLARADAQRSHLPEPFLDVVDAALAHERPIAPRDADRASAIVLHAATIAPAGRRNAILHTLAASAIARLRDQRVPGSRWARATGCGVFVEGEPAGLIGCGMGHVAERSQRFLDFIATSETHA